MLSFCTLILLFSSFSYVTDDERFSTTAVMTDVLLMARVLPLAAVAAICVVTTPVRHYYDLARELTRPPFVFWIWYALVAMVSGFSSGLSPLWSSWKCIEVLIVVVWTATIALWIKRSQSTYVLRRCFFLLTLACNLVSLFALSEIAREGSSIREYVVQGLRLDTTWPHINSITLSVISLFGMCGGVLLMGKTRSPLRLLLLIPAAIAFGLARSRTGLLGLFVVASYALLSSSISKGKKLGLISLGMAMLIVVATSQDFREWMRIDTWEEIARGAGRIRTQEGNRSGWGETVRLIEKSPTIGVGFTIVRRFVDQSHIAVDNFVLQSLVAAGFLGATPMILYTGYLFVRWLGRIRTGDRGAKQVAEWGLLATCLGVVKSLTTNGVSAFDVSLILVLLGAVSLRCVSEARDMEPSAGAELPDRLEKVHS